MATRKLRGQARAFSSQWAAAIRNVPEQDVAALELVSTTFCLLVGSNSNMSAGGSSRGEHYAPHEYSYRAQARRAALHFLDTR
jgi:hypothetical protein